MAWATRYLIPRVRISPTRRMRNNELTIDVTIYVKDWVKRTNKPIIL